MHNTFTASGAKVPTDRSYIKQSSPDTLAKESLAAQAKTATPFEKAAYAVADARADARKIKHSAACLCGDCK